MIKHPIFTVNKFFLLGISILVFADSHAAPDWIDEAWIREKARLSELGSKHASAWDLYTSFLNAARQRKTTDKQQPDWSGLWERNLKGSTWQFDPDVAEEQTGDGGVGIATAKLTPAYHDQYKERRRRKIEQEIDFDPIGNCRPIGFPRWFTEPFPREFIVTPSQTWLINELGNDIRRIYTDGRGHPSEYDRYPLINGDSIGFWDEDKLIVHTRDLKAGRFQRVQPDHSDQIEVVERWQKVDNENIGSS